MRSLSTFAQPMPGIITSNDFDAFVFDGTGDTTRGAGIEGNDDFGVSHASTSLLSETLEKLI